MIMLTGANGFVGNSFYKHCKSNNIQVKVALRNLTPQCSELDSYVVGDINSNTNYIEALQDVEFVVHLAARVHIMEKSTQENLSDYRQVNVEGTRNLAIQAANAGVKRFIFISSIKVNGESTQPEQKYTAEDIPNPEDAYAISKYEAEQALLELATKTGMEVVIIRFPLVYGPGVKANFRSLMNIVSKGFPLPLGVLTNNRRSLVGVDNLVDFIITCINHSAAANQVFLVSDDEDLSTAELLHRMYKSIGAQDRLFSVPLWFLKSCATAVGKNNFFQRLCGSLQVDISKSKNLLNWSPTVSVDEGLRRAFGGH